MKLNYKKINPWFFLIGIVLCAFMCAFNALVIDSSKGIFWLILSLSEILCIVFFYRFNNGLIALLRGRFAMPSKKDEKFVDYSKPRIKNAEEIKEIVSYGEKCLIMYKLNSREILQIYRKGDRLVVHKCFPEKEQNALISDFENALPSKNDWVISISEIKSITFGTSKTNYDLPIFSINRNNKNYRFIGYFEPVTKELLKEFFVDICKVKTRNGEEAAKKSSLNKERTKFLYNLLHLATAIIAPSLSYILVIGETEKTRILGSVYMIIALVILLICLLIVILNKNKLILEYEDRKDSPRELIVEFIIINMALYLNVVDVSCIINTGYFLAIAGVLFAALTFVYFKTNPAKKPDKKETTEKKLTRIAMVLLTVAVIGASSANLVLGANYVIPLRTTTERYAVLNAERNTEDSNFYNVTIRVDYKEKNISVSKERLEKNASFIKATKTRGILGIEYITKDPI